MFKREEMLAGMARQAITVLHASDNPGENDLAHFMAFLETVEGLLPTIRINMQHYFDAKEAGRVDDMNALRQHMFTTCLGVAVSAMSMCSHYPGLGQIYVPDQLKELWGLKELKH